jgi:protein involved in temperature-dependent protein secretion
MLDRNDEAQLDPSLDVPAISVQYSTTIGQTRNLAITTGLPLDCTKSQLDALLDRLVAAGDRQRAKHDLEQTRALLKNEEQNLHLHRQQITVQEMQFHSVFQQRGRKGDWKPTGSEAQTLTNLAKNVDNSVERIKKLRADIEEMEGKCR